MNTQSQPDNYRWQVLTVVMLGTVMSALDQSIVNVSLPSIMASFGANVDEIEWVVTGYMLGFSTFMPVTAWLRDRIGHRTLYIASLAIFTIGSLLCGVAWSLPALIVARVIQAFGGGAITPTGMAMIAEVFPPAERGRALGIWGVGVIVGPAIGPTLGGYLTDTFGWRSIFDVNLPVGIIGIIAALRVLRPEPAVPAHRQRPFDLAGFTMLSIALVAGLLALSKGNQEGWTSTFILTCGGIALFSFVFFLVIEGVVPAPIMELELFKYREFTVSMIVTAARSVALYGGVFLMPLFLQTHMGLGEVETGELMLPGALVIGFVMPMSARIASRTGPRLPVVVGLILTGLFMWMYRDLDPNTSTWDVLMPTFVRGVGLGLLVTPVMTVAINSVPTPKAGMASSMLNLIQQVAGSVGIAALGTVLGNRTLFHMGVVGQSMSATSPELQHSVAGLATRAMSLGLSPGSARMVAGSVVGRHAAAAASVAAFDDSFLVGALIVVIGLVPAFWLSGRGDAVPLKRGEGLVHAE